MYGLGECIEVYKTSAFREKNRTSKIIFQCADIKKNKYKIAI